MNLSPGEILFYGGIAGMAIVLVVTIVMITVMSGNRRRLRQKLNEEYGVKLK